MDQPNKGLKWLYRNFIITTFISFGLFLMSAIAFYYGYCKTQRPTLVVLLFHDIVKKPYKPWDTTMEKLDYYIEALKRNKYEPVDPENFENLLNNGFEGRKYLLTFDDGTMFDYHSVKHVYEKYGVKSTVFLVEDYFKLNDCLNQELVRELHQNCGTYFGMHGKFHVKYSDRVASGSIIGEELEEARKNLSEICGFPVKWLSYPFGDFNEDIIKSIKDKCAINLAFTIEGGYIRKDYDRMKLNRFMYMGGTSENLEDPIFESILPPEDYRNGSLIISQFRLTSV